jgi:hypothetical protein
MDGADAVYRLDQFYFIGKLGAYFQYEQIPFRLFDEPPGRSARTVVA